MVDAGGIDSDPLLVPGRDRIEETETFYEPSTAPAAAVGHHHVVEGPALRARSGESNSHHRWICFLSLRLPGR